MAWDPDWIPEVGQHVVCINVDGIAGNRYLELGKRYTVKRVVQIDHNAINSDGPICHYGLQLEGAGGVNYSAARFELEAWAQEDL